MSRTIRITLGTDEIQQAISDLEQYQKRLEQGVAQLVEELVNEGAREARNAFGSTANVNGTADDGHGVVEATGDAITIMEFGAGMATMESHPMAGNAPHTIKAWEYSRTVGSGEGYLSALQNGGYGTWHFGGRPYHEVIPKHGLLDARDYIVNNVEAKARSVFK